MNRRKALQYTGSLAGLGLLGGSITSLLQSCEPPGPDAEWTPKILSVAQGAAVTDIVTALLPMASNLALPQFIDLVLADYWPAERTQLLLAAYPDYAKRAAEAGNERSDFLRSEERAFAALPPTNPFAPPGPLHFFGSIKELALEGFFNSEMGVKEYLSYRPIPGKYEGCIPLTKESRIVFSTDAFSL